MQKIKIEPFQVIGISVRTTNENGQSAEDIGGLWQTFISENIIEKIPNRVDDEVLSIYTNYESDFTKPYDTILGCRVARLDNIPEGMVGQAFTGGTYTPFLAKGDLDQGVIYKKWVEIWGQDLGRAYTADFEIFGKKSMDRGNAEVDIMIALDE